MKGMPLDIVILGLSITSSWGNGHATTYRGLIREFTARGHNVTFLERDLPWYAENRDMPEPPFCTTKIYKNIEELKDSYTGLIRKADFVIVGSYVPEGALIGEWVTRTASASGFYDIDTPVTLAKLKSKDYEYLTPHLISQYNLYLSFTGGPILKHIEDTYGSPLAKALYCSVDPDLYYPKSYKVRYDLGYIGTYSPDRQPVLERLMLEPARNWSKGKFIVAGPQYPDSIKWPKNVKRVFHLSPEKHLKFYNSQRFTLNITRVDMIQAGYSPSVRLFEASACAVPIISDYWEGLDTFLKPGKEILISRSPEDTLEYLTKTGDEERIKIGKNAMERVLAEHTAAHRAEQLEEYIFQTIALSKAKELNTLERKV